jgi:large subunit ribosomal protein L18
MSLVSKHHQKTRRRTLRVRNAVKAHSSHPRVSVYRSLDHIYAQLIDDVAHKTLVSASSMSIKNAKGDKKALAKEVGLELARKAKEQGIERAAFDRGPFLYHGRVKALAEGLREGGLHI